MAQTPLVTPKMEDPTMNNYWFDSAHAYRTQGKLVCLSAVGRQPKDTKPTAVQVMLDDAEALRLARDLLLAVRCIPND